ncbi:MAG: repeat-containing protein [Verrucomicrobiales bacterium]|nr:repeat-containing protein [Verrucomicrobiales bacterium]
MVANTHFKLAFGMAFAILCMAIHVQATDYQEWVASYARSNLTQSGYFGRSDKIAFMVTSVVNEPTNQVRPIFPSIVRKGSIVYRTGFVRSFYASDDGTSGSGSTEPTISAQTLFQLDKMLANLPGDGECLPPRDRRFLVQADVDGQLLTRVYDRGNLPVRVQELTHLAGFQVPVWVPEFKENSRIDSSEWEHDGFLALAPDRRGILYALTHRPLQFWDPVTHELVGEIRSSPFTGRETVEGMAYSPDGCKAVVLSSYAGVFCLETETWKVLKKVHRPRNDGGFYTPRRLGFTANGQHLLLEYDDELALFDTDKWERIQQTPEVPPEALQYVQAPDQKRAVVTLKSGEVALWDVQGGRAVTTLCQNVRLSEASFSPDLSLCATVTNGTNLFSRTSSSVRLSIWNSKSGKLETEMNLEGIQAWAEHYDHLLWSPDGGHLLAVSLDIGGTAHVHVFSVKTGRCRGNFSGQSGTLNGLILLPDGSQLIGGGNDGKIHFWDFKAAMKTTESFERSVGD